MSFLWTWPPNKFYFMLGPFAVFSVMKYTLQGCRISLLERRWIWKATVRYFPSKKQSSITHLSSPTPNSVLALTSCRDFPFQFPDPFSLSFILFLALLPLLPYVFLLAWLWRNCIFYLSALGFLSNLCFPKSIKLYFNLSSNCFLLPSSVLVVAFFLFWFCYMLFHHLITLPRFFGHLDEERQVDYFLWGNSKWR